MRRYLIPTLREKSFLSEVYADIAETPERFENITAEDYLELVALTSVRELSAFFIYGIQRTRAFNIDQRVFSVLGLANSANSNLRSIRICNRCKFLYDNNHINAPATFFQEHFVLFHEVDIAEMMLFLRKTRDEI